MDSKFIHEFASIRKRISELTAELADLEEQSARSDRSYETTIAAADKAIQDLEAKLDAEVYHNAMQSPAKPCLPFPRNGGVA